MALLPLLLVLVLAPAAFATPTNHTYPITATVEIFWSFLFLPRADVEAFLGMGPATPDLSLAPEDEIVRAFNSSEVRAGYYPLVLQFEKNIDFGPLVGDKVLYLTFHALHVVVPFVRHVQLGHPFTFRKLGILDNLIILAGSQMQFDYDNLFSHIEMTDSSYKMTRPRVFKSSVVSEAKFTTTKPWGTAADYPELLSEMPILQQPWFAAAAAKKCGAFKIDIHNSVFKVRPVDSWTWQADADFPLTILQGDHYFGSAVQARCSFAETEAVPCDSFF